MKLILEILYLYLEMTMEAGNNKMEITVMAITNKIVNKDIPTKKKRNKEKKKVIWCISSLGNTSVT